MGYRPRGLGAPGRKLWDAVTTAYSLEADDLALLEEACRVRDTIGALRAEVAKTGLITPSSQGSRANPALVEARQQALLLSRLLKALGLPSDLDDSGDGGSC